MRARRAVAVLLSALLSFPSGAFPATSKQPEAQPIGTVSFSDAARIAGRSAVGGTTLFAGDSVEVGIHGAACILLESGVQVRIGSQSQVRFGVRPLTTSSAAGAQIELEVLSGAAAFRTSEKSPVTARFADALVSAKGAQPAVGLIYLRSASSAVIGAEKGELLVRTAHDARSISLKEGQAVEVKLEDPEQNQTDTTKPKPAGRPAPTLSGRKVAILGTVIALATLIVAIELSLRNSGLTNQQQNNEISPFKFP